MSQYQHCKHIPSPLGLSWVSYRGRKLLLGIPLLPMPGWCQLPVILADSTSLWPMLKVVSSSAWIWLGSSQLHAEAGGSLLASPAVR